MPYFLSAIDARPGRPSPESGDMSELPDFVGDVAPGPEQTWLEPGYQLEMPNFTKALRPGHGRPSPESGNIIELPDVAVDQYFGLGYYSFS